MVSRFCGAATMVAVVAGAVAGRADSIVLQPEEDTSKDVFVYQFLPDFNFDSGDFQQIIGVTETSTGHDVHTLIEFDLSSVGVGAEDVVRATLNLYVINGEVLFGGAFGNPSERAPAVVEALVLGGPWDEGTVTWRSQPPPVGDPVDAIVVDGIERWVEIDVTASVQGWLRGDMPNFGLLLRQRDEVIDPETGLKVGVDFDSSAATNRPFLQIDLAGVPGDFDGDGDVDIVDFTTFSGCFGGSGEPVQEGCESADLDGDGDVDIVDFNTFAANFTGSR